MGEILTLKNWEVYMVTAVLGASSDPDRYAYKAMEMLAEYKHEAIPVHPREDSVLGKKVWKGLSELADSGQKVDTLTMYVNAALTTKLLPDIIKLKPRRVIFNPGAENSTLEHGLQDAGIEVVHGCTLVMLRTGQY